MIAALGFRDHETLDALCTLQLPAVDLHRQLIAIVQTRRDLHADGHRVGRVQVRIGRGRRDGAVRAAVTLIENAGSELVCEPSETLMMMFEYVPTWLLEGAPERVPVEPLKDAQPGAFCTEKVRLVPLGALV